MAASLKQVMKNLKEWSKANFGNVLKEIETLRNQLAELQLAGADRSSFIRSKEFDETWGQLLCFCQNTLLSWSLVFRLTQFGSCRL